MKTKRGGFMIGIGAAVGILLAAAGPAAADFAAATGGSKTNSYNVNGVDYVAHVFTNTGDKTFTVTTGGLAQVLVVGGGGAGGNQGGGGGGGGWVTISTVTLTNGSYTVTVGGGGAGSVDGLSHGGNGNPSSAFSLTAPGGGGGGSWNAVAASGYVGGGGCGSSQAGTRFWLGGTGVLPGGKGGDATAQNYGGGGGGANGNGQNGSATKCGDGGRGVTNDFLNGTPTGYGGGGGGSYWQGSNPGVGVDGGGGGGNPGTNGIPNTGGGGGGSRNAVGPSGGSGIVIVRYATATTVPLVYTLEATDLTTNSASLNGELAYLPGGQAADVRVYWGTNDAGPTAAGWMYTNVVASGVGAAPASYSYTATSLSTNYTYYYRYYATNTAGAGELWGDVQKFRLVTTDLGLAVYGYPAGTLFQWQNSEQGTSWSDVTNGTNFNLRVTKAMYTAKPYYRAKMITPSFAPVYSSTAKLRDAPPSGSVLTIR